MAFETNKLPDLNISGAHLIFKNFSGRETEFNRAGDRNFAVVIEDANMAKQLSDDGWNIHVRPLQKEDRDAMRGCRTFDERFEFVTEKGIVEDTLFYVTVNVRYDKKPPKIYLVAGAKKKPILLDEGSVGQIDHADIVNVDLTINPSFWQNTRGSGYTAYCKTMYVTIQEDVFAEKYDLYED